jgi:hypothetical protein
MQNHKMLLDPMVYPEWIIPHSDEWYTQLGIYSRESKYPWKTTLEGSTEEMEFAQKIPSYLGRNSTIFL